MERIVLDTNIVLSAAISPSGAPGKALDLAFAKFKPVYSRDTIVELSEKLNGEKFAKWISTADRLALLAFVLREAALIHPVDPVAMLRDPNDDKFVALALAAGAPWIITGDKAFLGVSRIRDIGILSCADFIRRFGAT